MSVHHDDKFIFTSIPVNIEEENKNRRIFIKEMLNSIQDFSISKASRIKGSTSADFADAILYSYSFAKSINAFINGIKDPNAEFDPYLIQPRQYGRSFAKFYSNTYCDNVFYEYHRKLITESYQVISINKFNSILEEIYENIKEDMKHGQREDYEPYSRAEDIRKNRKLPHISKRGRVTKRFRGCIKGIE